MNKRTFIIVGASLAGAKAAQELRAQGFDGRVLLIGAESERPYERPPLTKDYLRSESKREAAYVHEEGFYDNHEIELLNGVRATAIDVAASRITLEDDRETRYDRLLLTTGAEPTPIAIPGADLSGVHYLRTLADCEGLKQRLETGGRVAVIGAGWIGSEFAASARQCGLEVTLIDPQLLPNERIFGSEIGSFYRDVHAQHGIEMRLGERADTFEGDGALARVHTSAGSVIDCDFAVVGIGVAPRAQLASDAGLQVENGIIADKSLRTSAPNIFAAGDVANAWHPFYGQRIRVEHWFNALNQGPIAARSMLGHDVAYEHIPYFYSDQYEVSMEYSGYTTAWDDVLFRGDRDSGEFVAFWLREGRVVAGMNVNVWDVNKKVQALIRSRAQIDPGALCDPDTPLETLVREPVRT